MTGASSFAEFITEEAASARLVLKTQALGVVPAAMFTHLHEVRLLGSPRGGPPPWPVETHTLACTGHRGIAEAAARHGAGVYDRHSDVVATFADLVVAMRRRTDVAGSTYELCATAFADAAAEGRARDRIGEVRQLPAVGATSVRDGEAGARALVALLEDAATLASRSLHVVADGLDFTVEPEAHRQAARGGLRQTIGQAKRDLQMRLDAVDFAGPRLDLVLALAAAHWRPCLGIVQPHGVTLRAEGAATPYAARIATTPRSATLAAAALSAEAAATNRIAAFLDGLGEAGAEALASLGAHTG